MAGYSLACLRALADLGIEVHAIRYPVNNEAPFDFPKDNPVFFYERKSCSRDTILSLVRQIEPSLIVVSGWVDKDYLFVVRKYKEAIKVLLLDNQWKGSLKQYIASFLFRFTLLRHFQKAWVPGKSQAKYAGRLGFGKGDIRTGFYSCDFSLYSSYFNLFREEKKKHFPRRFIFTGRYYTFKGIQNLWEAFAGLTEVERGGWELWCLGTGDIAPFQHPAIRHFGFVQPSDMGPIIGKGGVFILPSHFEPWGVVVQEFAASGFPLICSSEVGAAEAFLEENKNGYIFKAGQVSELKKALLKMIANTDTELQAMGELSHRLAGSITPDSWAKTAISFIPSPNDIEKKTHAA
ncbi:MAG TPA: glycosyltransferase [Bacteroidia bacterium]|nr:glycosyltransferase [Bacteroidia bacterium]